MIKKLLTFLPILALALAPTGSSKAILINPESFGWSQLQITHLSEPGSALTLFDRENFPVGDHSKKFERQTQAALSNQYGAAISNATWIFESSPKKTVYRGTYMLDASGSRQSTQTLLRN